jgi:hypothetical protein
MLKYPFRDNPSPKWTFEQTTNLNINLNSFLMNEKDDFSNERKEGYEQKNESYMVNP